MVVLCWCTHAQTPVYGEGGNLEEHGVLLARFALEAKVRLNDEMYPRTLHLVRELLELQIFELQTFGTANFWNCKLLELHTCSRQMSCLYAEQRICDEKQVWVQHVIAVGSARLGHIFAVLIKSHHSFSP